MIALGIDSGSILAPFWFPKSDQIGPKMAPKSIKKVIEQLVEFGIDFKTIFGHFWAKMEVVFRGGQSQKSQKSEPWAQNVTQASRTGSQAHKIFKNHEKMRGEITFFSGKFCHHMTRESSSTK